MKLLILGYHSVSPAWPAPTSVTPGDFESQIRALLRTGWRPATLIDALTTPATGKTFSVTFDDAHISVLTYGAEILDRLGVPATVFVPTDYADAGRLMDWDGYSEWLGTEHEPELRCLTWDQLRPLAAAGWEIASHTCSHPRLTTIDGDRLADELRRSREVCEREMGVSCRSIAYPYSDVDDDVIRAARAAGYTVGATLPRRHAPPLPLAWPRVGVYYGDNAAHLMLRAWRRRHPHLEQFAVAPASRAVHAMNRFVRRSR